MSQEDYLGPQRGRTDLGALPYDYPKPAKEYRTLALTPQFKDESPAGNQHLRYEAPASAPRTKPQMWDLVPDTGENLTLFTPVIIKTDSDVTDEITVTVTPFTPAVDRWVVVTIDNTYAPVISMVSTWASYPSAYEFDGTDFVKSTIRLWKLVAPGTAGSVPITATVSGIRYVGDGALKVSWNTEQIPSSVHLRDVLMLR